MLARSEDTRERVMRATTVAAGTAGAIVLASAGAAFAQGAALPCENGSVTLGGTGQAARVEGHCDRAVVGGTGNTLTIDSVGLVIIGGSGNTVRHRGPEPEVRAGGEDNRVVREGG